MARWRRQTQPMRGGRRRGAGLVVATAVALAAPAAGTAGHALAAGPCSDNGTTTTCTYSATGAEQTFTVPAGVSSVSVTAIGGKGGNGYYSSGGHGDVVKATIAGLTGGATLYVEVGGNGGDGNTVGGAGGFNGGGHGGNGYPNANATYSGGGGGGASDVRATSAMAAPAASLATRLVVAGGGGGASEFQAGGNATRGGQAFNAASSGTDGTASSGGNGGNSPDNSGGGGGGGAGNGGGGGGGAYSGQGGAGGSATAGGDGAGPGAGSGGLLGSGGAGGSTTANRVGGAGGGGYYGGGGGGIGNGDPGGGGGGSDLTSATVGAVSSSPIGSPAPDTTGTPEVVITYTDPSTGGTGPGGGTATPELGSGELLATGLLPLAAALLVRRRRARRAGRE